MKKIDGGSERFGPETGEGFKEPVRYDGDKNRFIDEADELYDKPALMSTNQSGEKKHLSLEEAG